MKNTLKQSSQENYHIIGQIIEDLRVAMVTTLPADGIPVSRPMYVQEVDENGHLWFFALQNSALMRQVRENHRVNVTFSSVEQSKFLSTSGIATEIYDRKKMEEIWDSNLKGWFTEGLETEGLVLLRLEMEDVEFWDEPSSPVARAMGFVKKMAREDIYQPGRHQKVDLRH